MNATYALLLIFGFLAVVLLLEGVYLLWTDTSSPEFKRVRQRLEGLVKGESGRVRTGFLKTRLLGRSPRVHALLSKYSGAHSLDLLLQQAGSKSNVAQLLLTCLMSGFVGVVLGLFLSWSWMSVGLLALAFLLFPLLRVKSQKSKRMQLMDSQLPNALDLICRALKAGHAFSAALSMAGDDAPEPVANEFRTTFDEITFGVSTKTAMMNLAERVPNSDMRYFVMAVIIQLETGGNLTELLSMLSNLMRERFKLFGKIKTLTAEGRLSGYILTALPFVLAFLLNVVNPGYMKVLFEDPMGIKLVMGALGMMACGVFILWRIIDIRV